MEGGVAIMPSRRPTSSYASSPSNYDMARSLDQYGSSQPMGWGSNSASARTTPYAQDKRFSGVLSDDDFSYGSSPRAGMGSARRSSGFGYHSASGSTRSSGGRMRQPLFGESFRPADEEGFPVKTVLVGESSVGKSSIATRLCKDMFYDKLQNTVGAAYLTAVITHDTKKIKFELWDTAGQERYHSLAPMYYRDAYIAIVVYDITCMKSFQKAKTWVSELRTQMDVEMNPILAIIGNKCDLASKRQVSAEEAMEYATKEELIWMETSAASGENVKPLFERLVQEIPEEVIVEPEQPTGMISSSGRLSGRPKADQSAGATSSGCSC